MKLSIIIPSYKGADTLQRNLPVLAGYLATVSGGTEVIIVDDGSADNGQTRRVAEHFGYRFEANPVNMGKGAAVRKGILAATGEFRMFTDVDIPFEVDAFDRFLHELEIRRFDVVVGDRTLSDSSYFTRISGFRKLGSDIFSFIVGRLVAGGHYDTQCGLKGFRADAAETIFSRSRINGFAFDVELLYLSLKRGFRISRQPVVLRCQEGSSVNVLLHGSGMLFDLLRIKWFQMRGLYDKNI